MIGVLDFGLANGGSTQDRAAMEDQPSWEPHGKASRHRAARARTDALASLWTSVRISGLSDALGEMLTAGHLPVST
jgi:hypothetical protein